MCCIAPNGLILSGGLKLLWRLQGGRMKITERAQWKSLNAEKGDRIHEFKCYCLYNSSKLLKPRNGLSKRCPVHKERILNTYLVCKDCGEVIEIHNKANSRQFCDACQINALKRRQEKNNLRRRKANKRKNFEFAL